MMRGAMRQRPGNRDDAQVWTAVSLRPSSGGLVALPCLPETAQESPVLHLRLCLILLRSWLWNRWVPESKCFPSVRVGDHESRVNRELGAVGGRELISPRPECTVGRKTRGNCEKLHLCLHDPWSKDSYGRKNRSLENWFPYYWNTGTQSWCCNSGESNRDEGHHPSWRISGALFSVSAPLDWLVRADLEKRVDESAEQDVRGICSFAADAVFLFEQMASHLTPEVELKTCSFFFF